MNQVEFQQLKDVIQETFDDFRREIRMQYNLDQPELYEATRGELYSDALDEALSSKN